MPSPRDSGTSVTHLHPEHLFDKLGTGELSLVERLQLEAHAAQCETCGFELLVREDLAIESLKQAPARDWSLFSSRSDA